MHRFAMEKKVERDQGEGEFEKKMRMIKKCTIGVLAFGVEGNTTGTRVRTVLSKIY